MRQVLAMPEMPAWSRLRIPGGLLPLLAALSILLGAWAMVPKDAPLTQLEVRGEFRHLRPESVRAAAAPFLSAGFISADVTAVRNAVSALPWVARARVERQWPGAISVRVWEREPYARWNQDEVIDSESQVFAPHAGEIPTGLPVLGGSAGHEAEVTQTWQRLSSALRSTPFELSGLLRDARGEWTAQTRQGVSLRFGQNPPDERLPALLNVAQPALEGRWERVAYVDLRYTNGFAVGWRETEPQPETP